MHKFFDKLLERAERLAFGRAAADLRWWQRRARRRGIRAVVNLGYSSTELAELDRRQKDILLPQLRSMLNGTERVILDFGCGPGRFTADLALCINGRAVGVDPIQPLVERAPPHPSVEYHVMRNARIPLLDQSVDAVWICLVLTAITDEAALEAALREIERVLKPGGLVFLVENTSSKPNTGHHAYRTVAEYERLFRFARLEYMTGYHELDETISVLAGRAGT